MSTCPPGPDAGPLASPGYGPPGLPRDAGDRRPAAADAGGRRPRRGTGGDRRPDKRRGAGEARSSRARSRRPPPRWVWRSPTTWSRATAVGAELGVVVAYGRIIPVAVLDRLPMVNLHFSLLPRWRGAAPVERAILEDDAETGVCLMAVEAGLDTGRDLRRGRPPSIPRGGRRRRAAEHDWSTSVVPSLEDHLSTAGRVCRSPPSRPAIRATPEKIWPARARARLGPTGRRSTCVGLVRLDRAWTTFRGRRSAGAGRRRREPVRSGVGVGPPTRAVAGRGGCRGSGPAWCSAHRPTRGEAADGRRRLAPRRASRRATRPPRAPDRSIGPTPRMPARAGRWPVMAAVERSGPLRRALPTLRVVASVDPLGRLRQPGNERRAASVARGTDWLATSTSWTGISSPT